MFLELGLVSHEVANNEVKLTAACTEFCPHHVCHYLGMDIHDTTLISRNIPLQEGMVITIEPGIYVPKFVPSDSKYLGLVPKHLRGIGVRVEDDILITKMPYSSKLSCEVLTESVPKSVCGIENLFH